MLGSADSELFRAARILVENKPVIGLTGAGISAESGIPTFRGRNGLWRRYRAEDLATPEAFKRNPRLVWEWYKWRIELVVKARPNPGHKALVELESMGVLACLITQNVDSLHREAGQRCVVELHGNIRWARCTSCGYRVYWKHAPQEIPPRCPRCGGLMRPDVVWFGEPIPEPVLEKAFSLARQARTVIVIGTSGVVMPAALIPYIVKERGGFVVEVNVEPSALTDIADVFLQGRAGIILPKLVEAVRKLSGKH